MRAHAERATSESVPAENGGPTLDPAEIRALAFAAALGPARPPHSVSDMHEVVIDLAGEEALLDYLSRIAPVSIND